MLVEFNNKKILKNWWNTSKNWLLSFLWSLWFIWSCQQANKSSESLWFVVLGKESHSGIIYVTYKESSRKRLAYKGFILKNMCFTSAFLDFLVSFIYSIHSLNQRVCLLNNSIFSTTHTRRSIRSLIHKINSMFDAVDDEFDYTEHFSTIQKFEKLWFIYFFLKPLGLLWKFKKIRTDLCKNW